MEGLYLSFFRMPPALAEVHERQRRIIQTLVWFSLSLIVSVFVKDIGYAVALIGGLAALFIFFFPGRLSEINSLSPSIHIQVLQTDLHTFP